VTAGFGERKQPPDLVEPLQLGPARQADSFSVGNQLIDLLALLPIQFVTGDPRGPFVDRAGMGGVVLRDVQRDVHQVGFSYEISRRS
jgi:hypothetical protein